MSTMKLTNRLNRKGQAMVETALIIFFLVVLVFGMTEFGRAMYTKNTLTNAARAGARVAVVTPGSSFPSSLTAATVTCSSAGASSPSNPIYDAVCKGIAGGGIKADQSTPPPSAVVSITLQDPNNPTGSPTTPATGYSITVTVQSFFDPVLALFKPTPNNPLGISSTLTGQASMRYE